MAILVLSTPPPTSAVVDALRAAAPEIPVWTKDEPPPRDDAVEAILTWRLKPGELPRYSKLRVICATGAGVDKLLRLPDLPGDLAITRTVDAQQQRDMAQYVLATTLQFTRELPCYAAQQAAAQWRRNPVRPPARCRVGLLGKGQVALAVARAFLPLGYPVACWGRTRKHVDGVQGFAGDTELPALLAQSDILVNTLPLTPATRGLLDRARLRQLPRGAFVVHIGRGGQLLEDDLRLLLDDDHLAGAALDVFEREPLAADHWIWHHPKIVATPHIAGEASHITIAQQCLEALRCAREGLPQPRGVDRTAGY